MFKTLSNNKKIKKTAREIDTYSSNTANVFATGCDMTLSEIVLSSAVTANPVSSSIDTAGNLTVME